MITLIQPTAENQIQDDEAPRRLRPRHLRLLIVDDHPAVRGGLLRLLDDEPDFDVVAEAETAESAVALAEFEHVDVAIVDYQLGGRNGLWVSRRLKRFSQPPRVVIFSAYASDHLAASCIVAGADALVSKSSLGSELCDAIRSVAHGARLLATVPQPMADMLRRRLDDGEQPIFGMLIAGIPRVQIEETLQMSPRELDVRATAMLRKLEMLPGDWPPSERGRRRVAPGQDVGGGTGPKGHPASRQRPWHG